jgi:hypothetical protein
MLCHAVPCCAVPGYLRLHTNLGDLNIELHCDMVPRTCENFLGLCEMGYYNDTIFHRSIKNFMIQVGALKAGAYNCTFHNSSLFWWCGPCGTVILEGKQRPQVQL